MMLDCTALPWAQILGYGIGVFNVFVAYLLARKAKKHDDQVAWVAQVEERLDLLEKNQLCEDSFRRILQDELGLFELRLINSGQLAPRQRGKQ